MHINLLVYKAADSALGARETRLVLSILLNSFLVTIIYLFPPVAQFYI